VIISFYAGKTPDDRGRFLRDLQQWPDGRLESVHDFIQWMFPLREPSGVNPDAPVLDAGTISEFRSRADLQENLRQSWLRMLKFYGFEAGQSGRHWTVKPAANFAERAENWLSPYNHNHLRITRIIKCLGTLGLNAEARAFFDALSAVHRSPQFKSAISAVTFEYWQAAVDTP
jgi:Opioid growth factor receptor (OGFr) conserved region